MDIKDMANEDLLNRLDDGDNQDVFDELLSRLKDGEKAIKACNEIREIYTGMDGFIPETCPEGYQQRIIKKMYHVAVGGQGSINTVSQKYSHPV